MKKQEKIQVNELWKLLFETSESLRSFYERKGRKRRQKELTLSQFRVVSCIFFNESGIMRIKDIAEELGITAGGVSQSVESLVQAGLLTRCKDSRDRRAVAVAFSEYGLQVRQEVYDTFSEMFVHFLTGISEEEKQVFGTVLNKLLFNIKKQKSGVKTGL